MTHTLIKELKLLHDSTHMLTHVVDQTESFSAQKDNPTYKEITTDLLCSLERIIQQNCKHKFYIVEEDEFTSSWGASSSHINGHRLYKVCDICNLRKRM